MEWKGTFNIKKINPIIMEFMLYILLRGLLSCNKLVFVEPNSQ